MDFNAILPIAGVIFAVAVIAMALEEAGKTNLVKWLGLAVAGAGGLWLIDKVGQMVKQTMEVFHLPW